MKQLLHRELESWQKVLCVSSTQLWILQLLNINVVEIKMQIMCISIRYTEANKSISREKQKAG